MKLQSFNPWFNGLSFLNALSLNKVYVCFTSFNPWFNGLSFLNNRFVLQRPGSWNVSILGLMDYLFSINTRKGSL